MAFYERFKINFVMVAKLRFDSLIYTKIMNHEFYEGCGEKNCPWCNFVKRNVVQDSLRDLEIEELDD